MISRNGKVACTPFEAKSIRTEVRNGVQYIKQKCELTGLKLVFEALVFDGFSNELFFNAGTTVYVRAEKFQDTWAKEEFELKVGEETKKFILVPYEEIVLEQPVSIAGLSQEK